MMKVLITTDWYKPVINGVVTSVVNLKKGLEDRGHEVRVLTLSRTVHTYQDGEVVYLGSLNAGKIYPNARMKIPSLNRRIKELLDWCPDVVHSQCEFCTFPAAKRIASALDIPLIHTYHTIYEDYTHYFSPRRTWGRGAVRYLTRWLSDQVSAMIAPTEKIQDLLEGYGVSCPVSVVPSGIRTDRYARFSREKEGGQIRKQYGISEHTTVLLYVGRLAKEKNIEELIRFQSKARAMDTVLLLAGDGPDREKLEQEVREQALEDNVIFAGMIPPEQIGAYYCAGDVFVSGSTSETQGMTYIEALSCGLPLLCRKDDCLRGIAEEGKNGWQYETEEMFLQKLKDLIHMEASVKQEMCRHSRSSVKRFGAEEFAKAVEKIYEEQCDVYESKDDEPDFHRFFVNLYHRGVLAVQNRSTDLH